MTKEWSPWRSSSSPLRCSGPARFGPD